MTAISSELQERDQLPHFEVATLDGRRIRYDELWQRRNLALILTDPRQRREAMAFAAQLSAHAKELEEAEATVVVTSDPIPGLRAPCVVVADRWGEILHIEMSKSGDVAELANVGELLEWVRFARIQCPECPP
jgi:peroxiredoxin